jgi:hypothetical protein
VSSFSLREKDTPPGMEAVDRVGNKRSRMRGFYSYCPLTLSLVNEAPFTRERGKQYALFTGWVSKSYELYSGILEIRKWQHRPSS